MPDQHDDESTTRNVIDVDRIVEDIRRRAAERRAAGDYDRRILDARIDVRPGRVTLRPEVAYSTKPVVGPLITNAKQLLIRLQYHFMDDLVAQTNRAIELSRAQTAAEVERRKELQGRVDELEGRLAATEEALRTLTAHPEQTSPDRTA